MNASFEPRLEFARVDDWFERTGSERSDARSVLIAARDKASGKLVTIQRPAPARLADADFLRRFARDALEVRKLWHPALLRLYAVKRDDEGPYCVLEGADHGTLADLLEQGPLAESDALAVARDLAGALEHAHASRRFHGSLRPSCVLLGPGGTTRHVKLAGFGAGAYGALHARDGGKRKGDPYRNEHPADTREARQEADLHAFGKLLYHMATGEAPHSVAIGLVPPSLRAVVKLAVDADASSRRRGAADLVAALAAVGDVVPIEVPLAPSLEGTPRRPAALQREASAEIEPPSRGRVAPFAWRNAREAFRELAPPLEGGMGTVVKAKELATGRIVALKRMRVPPGGDDSLAVRFHREASSIARLNHPHILSLLQTARDAEGDYLVLEWAEGGSLRDRLDSEKKLPVREVVAIARKVASALSYAHRKGVVHRDLKPANILVTEHGEPKLADFGLARATGDLTITRSGGGAGTPLYMAPEQWIDARQADARTDVYSLGKVLYHLATGLAPIRVDRKKLPRELRRPILGAIHDDAEQRWQSMDSFSAALETAVDKARSRGWKALLACALIALLALAAWRFAPALAERYPNLLPWR